MENQRLTTGVDARALRSKFDGGLLGLIGIGFLQFFAILLTVIIGGAILAVAVYFTEAADFSALDDFEVDSIKDLSIAFLIILAVAAIVFVFCLLLGICWANCIKLRWTTRHTVIEGRRLKFNGTSWQLLGNSLKWFFLSVITLSIYSFWIPIREKQWEVKHTEFQEKTAPATQNYANGGYPGYPNYAGYNAYGQAPAQQPYAQYPQFYMYPQPYYGQPQDPNARP